MSMRGDQRQIPTVIVSRKVILGREAELERWMQRVHSAATMQPGYLSDDHQPPDSRHPNEWVVTYQFTDTDALEAWLASPLRRKLIAEGRELIESDARHQVLALPESHTARPVAGTAGRTTRRLQNGQPTRTLIRRPSTSMGHSTRRHRPFIRTSRPTHRPAYTDTTSGGLP